MREREIILFFDIDMTLYPASKKINELMVERLISYGVNFLGMTAQEAHDVLMRYYRDYGLAIRGLLKHHENVDPAHFDAYVDGWLPLESILAKDQVLVDRMNECSFRKFAFTNAGIRHAERVISILGLSNKKMKDNASLLYQELHKEADPKENFNNASHACLSAEQVANHTRPTEGFQSVFSQIIYTDYTDPHFTCKPERAAFDRALKAAGLEHVDLTGEDAPICVLLDDSRINIEAALSFGWKAVLIDERSPTDIMVVPDAKQPENSYPVIQTIHSFAEALAALNLSSKYLQYIFIQY